jgi:hypothetical protein
MPNFQQQEQKLVLFYVIRERWHDAKSEGVTEAHATLGRKTSVLTIGYFREPVEPNNGPQSILVTSPLYRCGPEKNSKMYIESSRASLIDRLSLLCNIFLESRPALRPASWVKLCKESWWHHATSPDQINRASKYERKAGRANGKKGKEEAWTKGMPCTIPCI